MDTGHSNTLLVSSVAFAALAAFIAGYTFNSRAPTNVTSSEPPLAEPQLKCETKPVANVSVPKLEPPPAEPRLKEDAKPAQQVVQKAVRSLEDVAAAEAAEEESLEDSSFVAEDVELKLVILVRNDLNMSKGKVAAQVGHAVLGVYRIALRLVPEYCKAWLFRAQAKITLKADDEAQMQSVADAARAAGLPVCIIEDAGRTEVEPGTRTVCGIGPAPKAEIDLITGPKGKFQLRLLS